MEGGRRLAVKGYLLKLRAGLFKHARGLGVPAVPRGEPGLENQARRPAPGAPDFLEPLRVIFDLGTERAVTPGFEPAGERNPAAEKQSHDQKRLPAQDKGA